MVFLKTVINLINQLYFNHFIILYKTLGESEKVVSRNSKCLSAEKLTIPTTTDNSLSTSIRWYRDSNFCLVFKGSCLKQKNATFTPPNIINFLLFMN